jgi:prevent-host-death family protein
MEVQVSIGELKRDLSGVINQAAYGKERIVIVSRGKPKAAMISLEDLERLRKISHYRREPQTAWLARADALRERTRQWQTAYGIEPLDSTEILEQLREERVDELLGMR